MDTGQMGAVVDLNRRRPVVVGIGDEDEHDAAVRFAAADAVRAGRPLHVVHVIDPPFLGSGPEQMLLTFEDARVVGEQLLQAAVDRAHEVVEGRVPVVRRWRRGRVVPVLVEMSEAADVVVLQHRQRTGLRRVVTGSVCAGVAGRAHVPVVSVPELWTDDESSTGVVLGLDDTPGSGHLLESAFALAAERKQPLVVVHGWFIASMYEEALIGRAGVEEARAKARSRIEAAMAVLAAVYPTVEASLTIAHARPADALVAASRNSALLVLGRRGAAHSVTHLGSVARALISESTCPVMILPPEWTRSADAGARDAVEQPKADH